MQRTGLYPGSFDPVTNGHLAMIEAAAPLVDRLVIAIGVHPQKAPFLSLDARKALLAEAGGQAGAAAGCRIEVAAFSGLVVDEARRQGATLLFRGVRDGTDLDYEMQMAGMNAAMHPGLQTVFLPATPATRHITATLVRQIATMGGDVAPFVPPAARAALAARTDAPSVSP